MPYKHGPAALAGAYVLKGVLARLTEAQFANLVEYADSEIDIVSELVTYGEDIERAWVKYSLDGTLETVGVWDYEVSEVVGCRIARMVKDWDCACALPARQDVLDVINELAQKFFSYIDGKNAGALRAEVLLSYGGRFIRRDTLGEVIYVGPGEKSGTVCVKEVGPLPIGALPRHAIIQTEDLREVPLAWIDGQPIYPGAHLWLGAADGVLTKVEVTPNQHRGRPDLLAVRPCIPRADEQLVDLGLLSFSTPAGAFA